MSGYELITFIANKGWNELILRFDGGSEIKVPISGIFKSTFSRTIKTGLFKQVLNVWGGVISFKRLNEINAIDFGTDNRAFVVCYGDSAYIYDYDQPGEVDGSPADHESDRTTSRTTGDPAERPNDFGETEPNDRTTGETTERPAEQVETDKAVDEQADVCVPSCEYEQTNETGNETDQIKDHRNLPSCDFDPNTCIQYILSLSTIICFISEWIIRSEIEKTLLRLDFLKNLIRDNTFIESDKEQAETGEKHANFECSACLSEQTNDNIANIEDTGVPDVPKAVIETVFIYETGCTHKAKGSYASIDIAAPWIFHQNNTNTVCLREQQAYTYIQTHVWRCKVFHPVQNKHSPYDIACKPPVFVKFAMSENRRPGNRYERKRATEYFTMSGFGVPGKFNSNETFYHERKQGTRLNGIVKIRGSTCF